MFPIMPVPVGVNDDDPDTYLLPFAYLGMYPDFDWEACPAITDISELSDEVKEDLHRVGLEVTFQFNAFPG